MVFNKFLIGDLLNVNRITLIKSRSIQVKELNLITTAVRNPVSQAFVFEATHISTDEDFSHRVQLPQNLFKPQFICCNTRNELIISSGYMWKVITFQGKCTEVLPLNSKVMKVITFQHVFIYVLCVYMDYEFE